jgi:hypothetical protein
MKWTALVLILTMISADAREMSAPELSVTEEVCETEEASTTECEPDVLNLMQWYPYGSCPAACQALLGCPNGTIIIPLWKTCLCSE